MFPFQTGDRNFRFHILREKAECSSLWQGINGHGGVGVTVHMAFSLTELRRQVGVLHIHWKFVVDKIKLIAKIYFSEI